MQLWGKISAVLSKSHDPWGLSCDFSPTSVGQPTSVYSQDCWGSGQSSGACLGGASPGARGSRSWQVGKEAAVATPPLSFTCWLTVVLSFSGGLGFSGYTPGFCALHFTPFKLSLHNQQQSSPWVCPLKPAFQHPAPIHTSRHVS